MLRLQLDPIGGGQVESGEFAHGLGRLVIDFTNQHADVAHGSLLIHSFCPCYHTHNLTQDLFALTKKVAHLLGTAFPTLPGGEV